MTTALAANITNIRRLEYQLERQKDDLQRMLLLDELAAHYSFTKIKKAQDLLAEMSVILQRHPNDDLLLNFNLHTAFIENQLYNHRLSEMRYEDAMEIVEERGDVKQQAEVYIDYAGTCINLEKLDLATSLLDRAAKLMEVFPEPQLEARIIAREAYLHLKSSSYTMAAELFLEAEQRIQNRREGITLKDYYFLTLILSGLGKIYERNDEIHKSVSANLQVVDICESLGMHTRLSWHYLHVGSGYMTMGDDESAESYFRKAIRIRDDISLNARAGAYANLGYICSKRKEYKEALGLYDRAEQIYKDRKDDDHANISIICNWKAKLFAAQHKKRKAENHFVKAFEHAQQAKDYKQLSAVCKDIATFYASNKDFQNAYEYGLMHFQMSERYSEEFNHRMTMELEVKYETEKKKHEAELLRLQATELQLKALRAQMNPHFMYNALNSIQNYITSNEVGSAAKYLAKFAKLMRQSLDYSDIEIISLEKEIEFLEDYLFINQKLRFEDHLDYEIYLDDEIEEDIMGVPTMIVQPYVENAIEHGLRSIKNALLKLAFFMHDDFTILCVVEDNGIGREKARELQEDDPKYLTHRSKGTSITEKRLEILHRSTHKGVFVTTKDLLNKKGMGIGTRVEIKIPLTIIQKT